MRSLEFAGYEWNVKESETPVGPGPGPFSAHPDDIFSDGQGLHLSVAERDGIWRSTEAVIARPLGYGDYQFTVEADVSGLERGAVLAGFLYESDTREIDIEFSNGMIPGGNLQYGVQPVYLPWRRNIYIMEENSISTHLMRYRRGEASFASWHGPAAAGEPAAEWGFSGLSFPRPEAAPFIFNFWMYKGRPPRSAATAVISSFAFRPA